MSPITDYDLGKAHGRVVIDYDGKGAAQAQEDMGLIEEKAQDVIDALANLLDHFRKIGSDFGNVSAKMSRNFGLFAGISAVLIGMSSATGTLSGALFKLSGGIGIVRSLAITLGGVPKSISGFPKVLKQIVILSSAITLFVGSTKLLDSVVRQIGKFVGSTKVIQALTAKFPALTSAFSGLLGFIPSLRTVGRTIDGWASPIHQIARMTLAVGALIAAFKAGTKFALGMTKAILKMGTASTVILALIGLVSGLTNALGQLSGVIGLLPGAASLAGIAVGTLSIGMLGFKDALKNMGDPEKFAESLKNLAPNAQEAAKAIQGLSKVWDRIRRNTQHALFAGIASDIKNLAAALGTTVNTGLVNVAQGINGIVREAAKFFQLPKTIQDINFLFGATRQVLNNLREATQPFLQALLDIAVVSADVFRELTEGAGESAREFANFIRTARESGELKQWILDGVEAFKQLIGIIANLGQIFSTIFEAFDSGSDGFLKSVNQMLSDFHQFLESAEGQQLLHGLADTMQTLSQVTRDVLGAALKELGPILVTLQPFFKAMAETIGVVLVAAIRIVGPMLQGIASALGEMAPILGPIVGFFLAFAIAGKVLTVGIGLLVGALSFLVTGISTVITIVKVLTKVMMANPWLALAAAIIALVILIVNNWDEIKAFLIKAWEFIKEKAEEIWDEIKGFFVGIWEDIRDFFVGIWNSISDKAVEIWNSISDFFEGIWDDVSSFFEEVWNDISDFLTDTWNTIVEETRWIWEPIVEIFKSIFNIIYDVIFIVVGLIVTAITNFCNAAVQIISDAWNAIGEFLAFIWEGIKVKFHQVWDPFAEFFTLLWDGITAKTTEAWNALGEFLSLLWEGILAKFHELWDPIAEFFTTLWENISLGAEVAWTAISDFFQERWDSITTAIKDFLAPIGRFFRDAWNSAFEAVRSVVNRILEFIGDIPGWILDKLGDLGNLLLDAGRQIIEGFLQGLKNAFRAVEDFVNGIAAWISANKGPLPYDFKLLQPAGQAIMDGLIFGLESKRSALANTLRGITENVMSGINLANSKVTAATDSLSTSTNVGIASTLALAGNRPATTPVALQAGANGTSGGSSASGAKRIVIENLTIPVTGNLDPTKPAEWKRAMRSIKEEIRDIERESA